MFHSLRSSAVAAFCLILSGWGGFAQTPSFSLSGVTSSYSLGSSTFGSVQYTIAIGISYGQNLAPGKYISQSQLTSDFQSFVSAYPSPQDPVEAILLSVANSFAQKYPQFTTVGIAATSTSAAAMIDASAGNMTGIPGLSGAVSAARRLLTATHPPK